VAGPAGALAFPALAETQRRSGRPEQAERVARAGLERAPHRVEGRVALALALLDQKRDAEARVELERLLGLDAEHVIAHDAATAGSPAQPEPERELMLDEGRGEAIEVDFGDRPETARTDVPEMARTDVPEIAPEGRLEIAPDGLPGMARHDSREVGSAGPADASFGRPSERRPELTANALGAPVVGELATLDPYPDEPDLESQVSFPAADPGDGEAHRPVGPPPSPAEPPVFDAGGVGDDELDVAFEAAESDREQMFGADDVAHAALASVPDEEEGEAELDALARVDVADGEDDLVSRYDDRDETSAPGAPFATETVAGLLERQGHVADAARLRERIASGSPPGGVAEEGAEPSTAQPATGHPGKQATLERWLDNLRRDER